MHIDFDVASPEKELASIQKKTAGLSVARLIVFLLLGAVIVVGLSEQRWLLALFFPISLLFIYMIILFNRQKDKQAFLQAVIQINANKVRRGSRDLSSFDRGDEFMDKKHPFASDLDLFGDHSLFQLINHTVNDGGRKKLSQWMLSETAPLIAQKRYPAVVELSKTQGFLLNFEAFGKAFLKEEKSKTAFYNWLRSPPVWKSWYLIPAMIGPIVGILLMGGVLFGVIPVSFFSLFILIGLVFLGLVFKPLLNASKVMPNDGDLKTFTAWAMQLENTTFSNEYLNNLQKPVYDGKYKASEALKALEQQSFMVQNRANLMYLIFNLLFWIDFPVLMRLERWKSQYAAQIQLWEDVFNEWQAMVSLAAFTADEELSCDMNWPTDMILEVENIKHPLISPTICIGNDFRLSPDKKIVLLTGSNMSGKTTFMRTLGINLVLGNLGLNAFATKFHIGPFLLFTSMRNTDNLGENVSSFYAELARIKALLIQAETGTPIFFLLDEILKGTNTTDRIMGSEALIRQLINSNCKGIISTHDIELSELNTKIPSLINHSFHSEIKENDILFDYKIKNGPCPSFNAHKLMELMGIRFT
ncbi:MAG: DNA mismatch repair protein [Anditalea sp.]